MYPWYILAMLGVVHNINLQPVAEGAVRLNRGGFAARLAHHHREEDSDNAYLSFIMTARMNSRNWCDRRVRSPGELPQCGSQHVPQISNLRRR
jgi:hypothetical protein